MVIWRGPWSWATCGSGVGTKGAVDDSGAAITVRGTATVGSSASTCAGTMIGISTGVPSRTGSSSGSAMIDDVVSTVASPLVPGALRAGVRRRGRSSMIELAGATRLGARAVVRGWGSGDTSSTLGV